MARIQTNEFGRVPIPSGGATIIAVALRNELIRFNDGDTTSTIQTDTDIRIRPTNTTATINTVAGTATTAVVRENERNAEKVILLQAGPKGGFTQNVHLPQGHYFVSANVAAVITNA